MFVRPVLVCLELLIFIFWHQICHDDFRMTSVIELTLFIFISQSVKVQSQGSLRSLDLRSKFFLVQIRIIAQSRNLESEYLSFINRS